MATKVVRLGQLLTGDDGSVEIWGRSAELELEAFLSRALGGDEPMSLGGVSRPRLRHLKLFHGVDWGSGGTGGGP